MIFWKFKLGRIRIYITTGFMRLMQPRYRRDKADRIAFYHEVIEPLIKSRGGRICDICGKYDNRAEIHHILPYNRFPYLERKQWNLMLVCRDCHREIHSNPFLESSMIAEVAKKQNIKLDQYGD